MRRLAIMVATLIGCGKPNIDASCVMNGLGEGECSFTNKGDAKGATCGKVVVVGPASEEKRSETFCSGEVAPKTTTKMGFRIIDVEKLCTHPTDWREICKFHFLHEGAKP